MFDSKTEILTAEGFKFIKEINFNDSVAILNDNTINYRKIFNIISSEYDGDLYLLEAKSTNLCITLDHPIYFTHNNKYDFQLRELDWVVQNYPRWYFYRSCKDVQFINREYICLYQGHRSDGNQLTRNNNEKIISVNDWMEFFGWFTSEGSTYIDGNNHCTNITQKIGPKLEKIKRCVEKIGFNYYEKPDSKGCIGIQISSKQLYDYLKIFGKADQKYIPSFLLNFDQNKLRILFDSLMAGDGKTDGSSYCTVSKRLSDNFQELCIKLGMGASISEEKYIAYDPPQERICYRININKNIINLLEKDRNIRKIPYRGIVYNVDVPNQVIMTRRNGKVCWVGT